jgi:hypothetical protein
MGKFTRLEEMQAWRNTLRKLHDVVRTHWPLETEYSEAETRDRVEALCLIFSIFGKEMDQVIRDEELDLITLKRS